MPPIGDHSPLDFRARYGINIRNNIRVIIKTMKKIIDRFSFIRANSAS